MRRLRLLPLLALGFSPEAARAGLRWDARTLYERGVCPQLALAPDGSALELESGELLEDDGPAAGFSYKPNEETLSGDIRLRKELILADPRARAAMLLVGPGGKLEIEVNGILQKAVPPGRTGKYWQSYPIDPGALREGRNEIVLRGSGKIWIARYDEFPPGTALPRRSARSGDGGKTWPAEDRGEYAVRLRLDRHRTTGSVTLPVLDLANLEEKPVGPAATLAGPVRISVESEGSVTIRARTGPAPLPGKDWSDWREGGIIEKPAGRYIQVSAQLSTSSTSLLLDSVADRARVRPPPDDDYGAYLRRTGHRGSCRMGWLYQLVRLPPPAGGAARRLPALVFDGQKIRPRVAWPDLLRREFQEPGSRERRCRRTRTPRRQARSS